MEHSDYDKAMQILSQMEEGRPVPVVSISQRTGLKLAEVIRLYDVLMRGGIIQKRNESGVFYYKLMTKDYADIVDELFEHKEESETSGRMVDSREHILQRRRSQKEAKQAANDSASERRQDNTSPEPLTAIDLMNMRRSSSTNPKVSMVPGTRWGVGDSTTDRRSSTSNRAVFVNKGWSGSRSSFTLPKMDRSDTNFKQVNTGTHIPNLALIPSNALTQTNNEITVHDLRNKLGITADVPLMAILSPRPTHEVWEACSALVNAGGGILILGMRQYGEGEDATFFVKSVNDPEEAIKNLMRNFANRDIISDNPKNSSFIETMEIGKKYVLVFHLSPSLFNDAPLFLARDSFGRRTNEGCFIYRDGKVEKCTADEVKALWAQLRLGNDEADWNQSGEQVPVQMDRKVKLTLPSPVDDAVRPLSRKESTYGQPLPPQEIHFRKSHIESDPVVCDETCQEKETASTAEKERETTSGSFDALVQDGTSDSKGHRHTDRHRVDAVNTRQGLLFAEDIRSASEDAAMEPKKAPEPHSDSAEIPSKRKAPRMHIASATLMMPPDLAHADRSILEKIAAPAVEYTRLPVARVSEIVTNLLKEARLTPEEIGILINRKLPAVKKILNSLKENEKYRTQENTVYIGN